MNHQKNKRNHQPDNWEGVENSEGEIAEHSDA
jgi:hypothetical protein